MSHVSFVVKKTFLKVFKAAAEENQTTPDKINLGIYFVNGECKFEIYKDRELVAREVDLSKYVGIVSFGLGAFIQTVGAAGPKYAAELTSKLEKKVVSDDINVLMQYVEDGLPKAILMAFDSKQRNINIEEEFLK